MYLSLRSFGLSFPLNYSLAPPLPAGLVVCIPFLDATLVVSASPHRAPLKVCVSPHAVVVASVCSLSTALVDFF